MLFFFKEKNQVSKKLSTSGFSLDKSSYLIRIKGVVRKKIMLCIRANRKYRFGHIINKKSSLIFALLFFLIVFISIKGLVYSSDFNSPQQLYFKEPHGIAFDSRDHLFVADTGNNRIVEFDENLKLVKVFGDEGDGHGQFRRPMDLVFDSKGRMIITDSGNNRIQVFGNDGKFEMAFGEKGDSEGRFNMPSNVSADDRDNIIVTDRFNHRLQVFNPDGKHLFTLSNREGEKSRQRIEKEKRWAVEKDPSQKSEDVKVNPRWERTDTGQLNEPGGVWIDVEDGELWLANGWNCRTERFWYDSKTGIIKRKDNEALDGIIWGPWVCRNCTGIPDGGYIHLSSPFGILQIFEKRRTLNSNSKFVKEVTGGFFGNMKEISDIEIGSKGQIAVADKGNNRVVIFDKNFDMPENPYVKQIRQDGAEILWNTKTACSTELMIRRGDLPENTREQKYPWIESDNVKTILFGKSKITKHLAVLKDLEPGSKYFYKLKMPELKVLPGAGWSREYAVITHAKKGQSEYVRSPVKMLLLPNVIDVGTVKENSVFPEPMSQDDIERYYKKQVEQTILVYWVNSRMKYFIDLDFYVDEAMYRTGDINKGEFKDEQERKKYEQLAVVNADGSLNKQIKNKGNEKKIYFGQVICICERMWDNRGQWDYRGSGGGTYGIEWPTPGRSSFLGGSDVAWLFCHEYKHQVESNYDLSGLDKEEDRMWFCHFAPVHTGWEKPSAADHGEHWDGIAWQLRHHKRDSYLRALYSFAQTVKDTDGDGIPDDAPELPLDEKRLGSDPTKKDSDGDGLNDMDELLSSTWVKALNLDVRKRIEVDYIRPNLTGEDSDGDGVIDGRDKYPLYPYSELIHKGDVELDGVFKEWDVNPQIHFKHSGVNIEVWSKWYDSSDKNSRAGLYHAIRTKGDYQRIEFILDMDADGFYRGNDNLKLVILPDKSKGMQLQDAVMHICQEDRWPFFDSEKKFLKPEKIEFFSSVDGERKFCEFKIPRLENLGLKLEKEEKIGLMIYIFFEDGSAISVFEPYSIFDCTLID